MLIAANSSQPTTYADLIECLKVANRRGGFGVVWELVLHVCYEHAKLRPPVPHVVQPAGGGPHTGERGPKESGC